MDNTGLSPLFDLILDIKLNIIEYLPAELWRWFAMHDPGVLQHSVTYRKYYIEKYTIYSISDNHFPTEKWKILGLYHREPDRNGDRPAKRYRKTEYYYMNNKLHRDNAPAIDGVGELVYYHNGMKHRDNENGISQPAEIVTDRHLAIGGKIPLNETEDDQYIFTFSYYKNGLLHRDNDSNNKSQPAVIHGASSESMRGQYDYLQNGCYYRTDGGPTIITADSNEFWLLDTCKHTRAYVHDGLIFINAKQKTIASCELPIDILLREIFLILLFIIAVM